MATSPDGDGLSREEQEALRSLFPVPPDARLRIPTGRSGSARNRHAALLSAAAVIAIFTLVLGIVVLEHSPSKPVAHPSPSATRSAQPTSTPPTVAPRPVLPCPKKFGTDASTAGDIDLSAGLVPHQLPTAVQICQYGKTHSPDVAQPKLTFAHLVTRNLGAIPDELGSVPRKPPGHRPSCVGTGNPLTERPPYVFEFVYETGVVWVADPGFCSVTTNGKFETLDGVGGFALLIGRTGRWPISFDHVPGLIQAGPKERIVPPGATSIFVNYPDGTTHDITDAGVVANLTDLLDSLPSRPTTDGCDYAPGSGVDGEIGLYVRYPREPDVFVAYLPNCSPQLDNGYRQATDADHRLPAALRGAGAGPAPAPQQAVDDQLVPPGATSITLLAGVHAVPTGKIDDVDKVTKLTQVLDSLPDRRTKYECQTVPKNLGNGLEGALGLDFHYPSGSDVRIVYQPHCNPPLGNGHRQAFDPHHVVPAALYAAGAG